MKYAFLLLFVAIFFVACGPNGWGHADIRLKRHVMPDEAAGIWKLRSDCLKWLANEKAYQTDTGRIHQIELRPDGTCHFCSILQYPIRYVNCEGTWKLVSESDKISRLDLVLKIEGGYALSLAFTELFGTVEVFDYWGDPDECQILRFEKTGQTNDAANRSQSIRSVTNSKSSVTGSSR